MLDVNIHVVHIQPIKTNPMEPTVPHTKPTKTMAEARADLASLNDPDAFRGHPGARMAVWREASEIIRAQKRPALLIIANDNTGDAA